MKNKKAYIIYLAIQEGNSTLKDIVSYYTKHTGQYISDVYVRYICELLRDKLYITSEKIDRTKHYKILKEISGPIDIKL